MTAYKHTLYYSVLYMWLYAETATMALALDPPSAVPPAIPTEPSNGPLLGVSVALAVLILTAVGACVPAIACVYFKSRHSRKQITERYNVCILCYMHVYGVLMHV